MKKILRYMAVLGFVFFLLIQVHSVSSIPIYNHTPIPNTPALQIQKYANVTGFILVNSAIRVSVNITNFGLQKAFNLSITEPAFSTWTAQNVIGFTSPKLLEFDSNSSYVYSYDLIFKKSGNFTLEPTTISYQDANGNKYSAKSDPVYLEVRLGQPPSTLQVQWQNIFLMSSLILLIPIIILIVKKQFFQ